ncbi:serine hydrolase [Chamaesiphon minutus]|uniref:Beta-lactamase class A n=1 Tax=Chamaesiphon minutus (strain ATCC 27169 / PCC 6605) TaxID=1173020 RepID=K9UAP8_CHAP6|nr:serine hydrolase [Chamaesiphon minutus]AFY91703.1 beta-lactamase class A [Chamaesiphon minutus PCC 6605]
MKLNWLLTGLIGSACLLLAAPAQASKFTGWEFKPDRNQLNFGTDTGVQPKATLLDGPYRLVVDLPGTKMTEATVRKQYGAAVREVRIAQSDRNTTRLVMELAPGYGVSPQNIIIRSDIPSRWSIKLRTIERGVSTASTGTIQTVPIAPIIFAGVVPIGKEMTILKSQIKALAAKYGSISPGMFFMEVETGNYLDINGEKSFPAASTIKLPILMALFQAVDAGKIKLDEKLTVRRDLITGGSGRLQNSRGAKLSVLQTATKMIVISDNTATNMIIDRLGGRKALNSKFKSWGLRKTVLNRMLGDFKGTNTTSPADLVRLSALLAKRQLITETSRSKVLDILNQTANRKLLPAGLGKGAAIAHKTGTLGRLIGDAGIIEMPNGKLYLAGIFVKRSFNDVRARDFVQAVSKLTYNYINNRQVSQK